VLPAAGARLHRMRVLGHDVLRTPLDPGEHEREPFFWGAYVMAPWCNRLLGTPIDFRGSIIDPQPNFEDGSAIHGQVYAAPWERVADNAFAIEAGGDGWPWRYRVESAVEIDSLTLSLNLRLTNLSESTMPGGIGLHPWLAGSPVVTINAELAYASNVDPSAQPAPVSDDLDMRRPRRLTPGIDATWTGLARPPVELGWPDLGLTATLEAHGASHIVAASVTARSAIAVEPQTHAPHGLRRLLNRDPGGLDVIDPGAAIELRLAYAFRSVDGSPA